MSWVAFVMSFTALLVLVFGMQPQLMMSLYFVTACGDVRGYGTRVADVDIV